MLKELIEYLFKTAATQKIETAEGVVYFDKPVFLPPDERKPHLAEPCRVASLSAIVEYLKANRDELILQTNILHIVSPARVELLGPLDPYHRVRETVMVAEYPVDGASALAKWTGLDAGRIILMAQFAPVANDDRDKLLIALRSVVTENLVIREDGDGVSQSITVREGAALKGLAKIENPVALSPFNTFTEIPQVTRPFIFRMDNNANFTLQPADGRAWERVAVERIKEYLESLLGDAGIDVPVIG